MITSRPAHSAQVSMVLHLGAQDVPLAQMGPDFIILENSQIDWAKYQPSKPPALRPKKQLRPHQSPRSCGARRLE